MVGVDGTISFDSRLHNLYTVRTLCMGRETNVRAPVESSMPPLKEACAAFKGFAAGEKCGERVFQMLLAVIQRCRGAKPKRFYTLREVAVFFGIGHGTA